jgi:ABC-2 type transport system ATP-binding protein
VLVSSHLLSEVEQVCTHIGVMHVGRLLTQGPIAQVRAVGEARARVVTDRPQDAARVLRGLGLTDVVAGQGLAEGILGTLAPEKVVVALVQDDVPVTGFAVERPSLEDLFVSLTGEGFNVSG